ncbi:MAG: hypothetical protein HC900_00855 [Methylacidiphilales bacterium]|nr:hypothetical protein [Candidatus Methylacidiphilales bacterium]
MAGRRTFFFEGLGVSEGIAIGPAYLLETDSFHTESYEIEHSQVEFEVARLREAVAKAAEEVTLIGKTVAERIDHQQAAIFDAHLMMLEDPMLIDKAIEIIRSEHRNAESVLWDITRTLVARCRPSATSTFRTQSRPLRCQPPVIKSSAS